MKDIPRDVDLLGFIQDRPLCNDVMLISFCLVTHWRYFELACVCSPVMRCCLPCVELFI